MTEIKDTTDSPIKHNGYLFSDYLKVLFKHKKFIIISTVAIGLITAFLMFFIADPIYLSSATVKSAGSGLGIGGLLGASGLPDLGGLEELSGGSSSKEIALYDEILKSRRCIDETIIKFNLLKVYDIEYMQDAVKYFREEILMTLINKKAGTLSISVYDKDKQRAKEITEFLIFQLNKIFSEMSALNAKNNKEFIEQRYDSAKQDLTIAEDSLKKFQDKFGISPEIQAEVASKASFELEVSIKSEELKLELLKKMLSDNQPEIKEQEDKIAILKKQSDEINNSVESNNSIKLKGLPEVLINFLRLRRNLEIQNKILTTLIPIYEQAKFEEKRETPTVIVLDYPNLPEKKAKPKRLTITLISMIAFLFFISTSMIFYDLYYKRLLSSISKGF